MNSKRKENRRQVLRSLGAGLAGIFVAGFARKAESGIFASVSLQDGRPLPVPAGHYDEAAQLYVDSRTGAPMFASPSEQRTGYCRRRNWTIWRRPWTCATRAGRSRSRSGARSAARPPIRQPVAVPSSRIPRTIRSATIRRRKTRTGSRLDATTKAMALLDVHGGA